MCTGLLFAVSCTNLDEDLPGSATSPFTVDVPNTTFNGGGPGPADALAAAFGRLRDAGSANHGGYWSVQSVSSDEMAVTQKGGDWYDGGIWIDMHRHTYGPASGPVNDAWNQQYNAIAVCNELLASNLGENEQAQLRVLRAFLYYRLMDLFGNVKIVTAAGQNRHRLRASKCSTLWKVKYWPHWGSVPLPRGWTCRPAHWVPPRILTG